MGREKPEPGGRTAKTPPAGARRIPGALNYSALASYELRTKMIHHKPLTIDAFFPVRLPGENAAGKNFSTRAMHRKRLMIKCVLPNLENRKRRGDPAIAGARLQRSCSSLATRHPS
jgi:hypothetical protein